MIVRSILDPAFGLPHSEPGRPLLLFLNPFFDFGVQNQASYR